MIVPKDMNPWFDQVYEGAKLATKMLEEFTGSRFVIEYRPPTKADVAEQNQIIENVIETHPDGISIDLLDEKSKRVVLEEAF